MVDVSIIDAVSQVQSLMKDSDNTFDSIVDSIKSKTECLLTNVSNEEKYNSIVSIEYLLVKLRLDTEFEQLKVKSILSSQDCQPTLRSLFLKRDQLLAQRTLKLNSIRDDISVLQKIVYSQKIQNLK